MLGINQFPHMKASQLIFTLLWASSVAVVQLAAQQTRADQKPIEEVKAKAEAGEAESQVELGRCYEKGQGVAKDQVEAAKWYRKAAEQNYAPAQASLGAAFPNEDVVEAYKWLLLAVKQGNEDAKQVMTELERTLRPEQRAQGQKLARDFRPR